MKIINRYTNEKASGLLSLLFALLIHVPGIIGIIGCKATEQISGKEFQEKIKSGQLATMHSSEYLCEQDSIVYLSDSTMSAITKKWTKKIYSANKNELGPAFYKSLVPKGECSALLKDKTWIMPN